MEIEPRVYSVSEFCKSHRVSRSRFYQLLDANTGPRLMRVGRRVLISAEAAADWRRAMERGLGASTPALLPPPPV